MLKVAGSTLNFIGGLLLTWEVLSTKRLEVSGGIEALNAAINRTASDLHLNDKHGRRLVTVHDHEVSVHRDVLWRLWLGMLLVTAGFLLGLVADICEL